MEQFSPDYNYFAVQKAGVQSMKDAESLIDRIKHQFRAVGATASIFSGSPVNVQNQTARFIVCSMRGISTRMARGVLSAFQCSCNELLSAADSLRVVTTPVSWPVRTKLAGRIDLDALYRLRTFETNQRCLSFANNVLDGGKRAGYSVVEREILSGVTVLAGYSAILLAEGFMSDMKLTDIETRVPDVRNKACCALRDAGLPSGGILASLAGYSPKPRSASLVAYPEPA